MELRKEVKIKLRSRNDEKRVCATFAVRSATSLGITFKTKTERKPFLKTNDNLL
tara:strand:- start:2197 stop:2358 length:162 start_codon:yes stop_codon:yes gene_type:complete